MSVPAPAAPALRDAKDSVMTVLHGLAAGLRDDASECGPCAKSLALCDYHGPRFALADLYERCAGRVRASADRDGILAAVMAAVDGEMAAVAARR